MNPPKNLNPQQLSQSATAIQKRLERQAKREAKNAAKAAAIASAAPATSSKPDPVPVLFTKRNWEKAGVRPGPEKEEEKERVQSVGEGKLEGNWKTKNVKIVSWNVLAQNLVRRDLFPGSDCLRWKDRGGPHLMREAIFANGQPDVLCLQEVDQDRLGPSISSSSQSISTFASKALSISKLSISTTSSYPNPNPTIPTSTVQIPEEKAKEKEENSEDPKSGHIPYLTSLGYSSYFFNGYAPKKKHGLLIAWKDDMFEIAGVNNDDSNNDNDKTKGIREMKLDEMGIIEEVDGRDGGDGNGNTTRIDDKKKRKEKGKLRTGLTRRTRNVALAIALRFKPRPQQQQSPGSSTSTSNPNPNPDSHSTQTDTSNPNTAGGIIISTTHLFWHPKFYLERCRQVALLIRELRRFRGSEAEGGEVNSLSEWRDWPCFFAGDINAEPSDPTYHLLMNNSNTPLTSRQLKDLNASRVVHESAEGLRTVPNGDKGTGSAGGGVGGESKVDDEDDEDEGAPISADTEEAENDPDRAIKNARPAKDEDGLFSWEELREMVWPSTKKMERANKTERSVDDGEGDEEGGVISAYGSYYHLLESNMKREILSSATKSESPFFGSRSPLTLSSAAASNPNSPPTSSTATTNNPPSTPTTSNKDMILSGAYEPIWTNFTPLWRLSLDYIFLLPDLTTRSSTSSPSSFSATTTTTPSLTTIKTPTTTTRPRPRPTVTSLLPMIPSSVMEPGLPKKNVSPSDHLAVGAEWKIAFELN